MKKDSTVINYICTKFIFSFLVIFSLYIQIFGELAPGGGFQAGALLASAIIGYDISISDISKKVKTISFLKTAAAGLSIYLITGLVSLYYGLSFLNYSYLGQISGQKMGIMIIEFGVGMTVSSVMVVIYLEIKNAY